MTSYAQFGEDLLIQEQLERIGVTNQFCFEVGAHNGEFASNTLMFRNEGWTALLAESHPEHFAKLEAVYGASAICVHELVTDMDDLLARHDAPQQPDFGVIDIDGDDYWLWHNMERFRPRIMLIEFSPYKNAPGYDPAAPKPPGTGQTARQPTIDLGKEKGYQLAGETFCNLLFVAD